MKLDKPQPAQGFGIHVRDAEAVSKAQRDALVDQAALRELATQSEFVLMAASDLHQSLSARDTSRLFFAIQALLAAAANITKLLWGGQGDPDNDRRVKQRKSLGVTEESPMHSQHMRNHFDHFAHRLEQWGDSSKRHNIVDQNVGPITKILKDVDSEDLLRNFDPDAMVVTFRGESLELRPLIEAVQSLQTHVRETETERLSLRAARRGEDEASS
jgi:hypothetical protein